MKFQNTKRIKRSSFYVEGVYKRGRGRSSGKGGICQDKEGIQFFKSFQIPEENDFFLTICA